MKINYLLTCGLLMLFTMPALAQVQEKEDDPEKAFEFEYIPDAPYDLVADRISCLQENMELNLEFNEKVFAFVNYFAVRDREYTRMILRRKNLYFPIFEEYLAKYNLPDELKYLSIVESGLNTGAISRVGAVGLWQFMPYTGRLFKLHQDWFVDERMDPYKATEAACKYLKELYGYFDDWELALASYNAGPGNVRKAIRRSGYKKTFWEVYPNLPRETRSYVPQLVAVIYVLNYAEEHNFFLEDADYPMLANDVEVGGSVNLKTLAGLIDVCHEDLVQLNPELKRQVVPDHVKAYKIRIPSDKAEFLTANYEAFMDSASRSGKKEIEYLARNTAGSTYGRSKIVYKVKSGDVLGSIASRYNVKVTDLRTWNRINGNLIRVGQNLTIYVKSQYTAPNTNIAQAPDKPAPVPESRIHLVQPGDTLWKISRQYEGLSIEKLKELNNLKTNDIKPGQKLVIG